MLFRSALDRIDEETGKYSRLAQTAYRGTNDGDVAGYVKAAFGSYFSRTFRDQTHSIGPRVQGDLQHVFRRRHLQVEISRDACAQRRQIGILNVAPIASQVNGDAVRACLFTQHSRGYDAGSGARRACLTVAT